ncbi:MAG: UbiA family prenyltransferase [Trueperaceae bacterium]|nr:UbiA family prenyltransferase [Trueperaceae bacterium]
MRDRSTPPRPPWTHPWIRHLRLPFNVLLTPIYLYGILIASGATGVSEPLSDPAVWLGWLSLHLFLYGGTTAFNSYYDRDEGPVGGMLHPPAVDAGLLPFSLIVQAVGLVLAAFVGVAFTAAWTGLFLVFAAYSHPAVRLKAHPAAALTAIALGQGAVGFVLGWTVVAPPSGLLSPPVLLRMAATAAIVTGLYIVTQSYQVREDGARGDRTLPVLLGPTRALRLAVAVLTPGGLVLVADVARLAGAWTATVVTLAFAVLATWLLRWAGAFDPEATERNYRTAMRISASASVGLALLLAGLLAAAPAG